MRIDKRVSLNTCYYFARLQATLLDQELLPVFSKLCCNFQRGGWQLSVTRSTDQPSVKHFDPLILRIL